MLMAIMSMPIAHHVLGLSEHSQKLFAMVGITFDNAGEKIDNLTKLSRGALWTAMEHKGVGGGIYSSKRICWQIKVMCILRLDVDKSKAIAWLQSLPDNDAYCAYS